MRLYVKNLSELIGASILTVIIGLIASAMILATLGYDLAATLLFGILMVGWAICVIGGTVYSWTKAVGIQHDTPDAEE